MVLLIYRLHMKLGWVMWYNVDDYIWTMTICNIIIILYIKANKRLYLHFGNQFFPRTIQFKFSVTQSSCVSLPRSTTLSDWKLLGFVKFTWHDFSYILIHSTSPNTSFLANKRPFAGLLNFENRHAWDFNLFLLFASLKILKHTVCELHCMCESLFVEEYTRYICVCIVELQTNLVVSTSSVQSCNPISTKL